MKKRIRIALVGATGLVGREIIRVLEESELVDAMPVFLASKASEGEEIPYKGLEGSVIDLETFNFKDMDVVVFATPKSVAAKYIPEAQKSGAVVLDISGASAADVPVAGAAVGTKGKVVACPQPAALALAEVLAPLHGKATVTRVISNVNHSTSSAGKKAMDELYRQSVALLGGSGAGAVENEHFAAQMAFNVLPQVGAFMDDGRTTMEKNIQTDVHKLLGADVPVSISCAYVPTFIGISQSVNVTFKNALTADEARHILEGCTSLTVIDNPKDGEYSTPFGAAEMASVYVSRVRVDDSLPNTLNLWIVADNLRAGVAESAVRMVEQVATGLAA